MCLVYFDGNEKSNLHLSLGGQFEKSTEITPWQPLSCKNWVERWRRENLTQNQRDSMWTTEMFSQ